MQYFQAVQKGKERASKSQMKMFNVAGFTAVIESEDGHVAVIVDNDGFTKAQSKAVEKEEAISIFKKLMDSGIAEYSKNEIQIWSQTRPTIQNQS
jgi:hypothetical protein